MIRSMTGFASKTAVITTPDGSKVHLSLTLKSLNSRFFEATCKLPYLLGQLEHEYTKTLKTTLHRGSVYLSIHMSNNTLFKKTVEPSMPLVTGYVQALEKIKHEFNISGNIQLQDLINLPDIFAVEDQGIDETTKEYLASQLNALIEELIHVQTKEGAAIAQDLSTRIAAVQDFLKQIEHACDGAIERQKSKIAQTLKELEGKSEQAIDLHMVPLYAALDKMDVHEEISRFKTHLASLQEELLSPRLEKGKMLDFTLQELARENNTIASKCADALISSLAINIKVELEKAREQVQNTV